jgi:prepilin-type N-terminal cleavage/methylation domain-containing protein
MMKSYKKGFTLIELLVVIAIIGILSGIVLTSLGSARDKARAASAKASLSSMRAEAELGADSAGNYLNNICNATTGVGNLDALITGAENNGATVVCYDDDSDDGVATDIPTEWAVEGALADGTFFCVDSGGSAEDYTTDPTVTSAGCP